MAHISLNLPSVSDSKRVGAQKLITALQVLQTNVNNLVTLAGAAVGTSSMASFTLSQPSAFGIAVDATASKTPTGTITSYGWTFGDGSTGVGVTTTHTYATAGTYLVTLTVTNSAGATDTFALPVTVRTATGGAYTQDSGQGTNSGAQVTGTQYTAFNASGTDFGAQATAAGSGKILSLPVGTTAKLKGFTSSVVHAADITAGAGVIGAGSDVSIVSQPTGASTGGATQSGTTSNELVRVSTPSVLLQDFQILGTTQSVTIMHGIDIRAGGSTVRRVKLKGASLGNDKAPPGEVFGLTFGAFSGGMLVEDVEIDGQGHGASGFATNGSASGGFIGNYTVNRLYTHDNWYSGGIALWQQVGDAVFNDCVFDLNRCHWNIERCTGTVTLNRPRIGALKAATSGWANGAASPIGIFCETDKTWTGAHTGTFLFKVVDPRNLDGTPYTGAKLGVNFGTGNDGGTNYYGTANFKAYSAAGADISSSFFSYGGKPGPGTW